MQDVTKSGHKTSVVLDGSLEKRLTTNIWLIYGVTGWYNRMAQWKNRTSRCISFFPPISQWCSIFDVLFTGGRGVSDFSVL